MFDVFVNKNGDNYPYRTNLSKRDAKKLIKQLRKNGIKCQLVTSKGRNSIELDLGEINEDNSNDE